MNEKRATDKDLQGKRKANEKSIPGKKIKEQLLRIRRIMVLTVLHLETPQWKIKRKTEKLKLVPRRIRDNLEIIRDCQSHSDLPSGIEISSDYPGRLSSSYASATFRLWQVGDEKRLKKEEKPYFYSYKRGSFSSSLIYLPFIPIFFF